MISLSEFLDRAPANLQAFRAAYLELQRTQPLETAPRRDETDWWREVAAYFEWSELDETAKRRGVR